jgi:hypothetical protein
MAGIERSSFRIAATAASPESISTAGIMDSGLFAAVGPGMTIKACCGSPWIAGSSPAMTTVE